MILPVLKSIAGLLLLAFAQTTSFEVENRTWREKRNKELRTEDGWLTVAGLFWLKEGSNSIRVRHES